jgi:hypothetical protein
MESAARQRESGTGNESEKCCLDHRSKPIELRRNGDKKKASMFAHRSQNGEAIYREHHEIMESIRGRESGVDRENLV